MSLFNNCTTFAPISNSKFSPIVDGEVQRDVVFSAGKKSDGLPSYLTIRKAFENNLELELVTNDNGNPFWRTNRLSTAQTAQTKVNQELNLISEPVIIKPTNVNYPTYTMEDIPNLKPNTMVIDELKWKYLAYCILKGKNLLLQGGAGSGKTTTARRTASALGRNFVTVNCASPDSAATFIGSTHFKEGQTEFKASAFLKAIQTPGTVILLDELSRIDNLGMNLLMPILDPSQRKVTIDESYLSETIEVAQDVTFIATANIGNSFTGTRQLDSALVSRFMQLHLPYLEVEGEVEMLLNEVSGLQKEVADMVADFVCITRNEVKEDVPQIEIPLDSRVSITLAEMVMNGFTLTEAVQLSILDKFDEDEQTYLLQVLQKYA